MKSSMKAIEVTGRIDEDGQLVLDEPLDSLAQGPVRVLLLVPEGDEISEAQWLHAAASNSAFDFLSDPAEDIYTVNDGKPFND